MTQTAVEIWCAGAFLALALVGLKSANTLTRGKPRSSSTGDSTHPFPGDSAENSSDLGTTAKSGEAGGHNDRRETATTNDPHAGEGKYLASETFHIEFSRSPTGVDLWQ